MIRSIKTAVSLPDKTFRRAEALRRKTKKSRSRLYAEALEAYFEAEQVRELESRYAAGYRDRPEKLGELSSGVKAGASLFEGEDW